jgi:hypothetical protein
MAASASQAVFDVDRVRANDFDAVFPEKTAQTSRIAVTKRPFQRI